MVWRYLWTFPGRKQSTISSSFSNTTPLPNFKSISLTVLEFWKRYHHWVFKSCIYGQFNAFLILHLYTFTSAKIQVICFPNCQKSMKTWLDCTVENRVVKSPKSDSSKFCFWTFHPTVNTPTKKKSQHKTPCKVKNLQKTLVIFLAAEGSTLEPNISGSVQILFNIYILIRKAFKSAFQWCILKYCQFSSFLVRGQNVKINCVKIQKI
jgi:hypothetical protein